MRKIGRKKNVLVWEKGIFFAPLFPELAFFFFFKLFVTENVNLSAYMLFNGYFRSCKDNTISNLPMCQCISSKGKTSLKKIT